jgi:tetratricopeptide (TPR) repeat protein
VLRLAQPDRRARVEGVPFLAQERLQCGPAALAMVLQWSGDAAATPDALLPAAYTPALEGSLGVDLVSAARRRGRIPWTVASLDGLLRELEAGHPVLVFQNLGLAFRPVLHFAVLIGFDLERRAAVLHTGEFRAREMSIDTFDVTWRRGGSYARVVLRPEQLPASLDEAAVLGELAQLATTPHAREAALAYGAASERWPQSLGVWLGLGRAQRRNGNLKGALAAYERATKLEPPSGAAFRELADVLGALGRTQDAVKAQKRARELEAAPAK